LISQLGAGHAVGVDIDPIAVTSAKQNASFNGFGQESLDVVLVPSSNNGEIPIENGAYDIVIANLLLNPVLQLSSNLLGYIRAGGCLGLSGILESQVLHCASILL
jgi:ribosomal protein L11 methylase PrmA